MTLNENSNNIKMNIMYRKYIPAKSSYLQSPSQLRETEQKAKATITTTMIQWLINPIKPEFYKYKQLYNKNKY